MLTVKNRPILYYAITNHGFGHATRAAAIAAEIQRQCPDLLLILATTAPRWLLESYIEGDFIHRPRAFDIGVIQSDSVTMDLEATLSQLQQLQRNQRKLIASEVNFLKQNRVALVMGDIPPLVAPLAKAAGLPVWMVGNFGWDFIYREWGGEFEAIADWIGECFSQCDLLFQLPLNEPMGAFPQVEKIGFTGGTPRYTPAELSQRLNITALPDKTALLTFGGLGLAGIPYANLAQFPDWQFLTFDAQAPEFPNLLKLAGQEYRPVDLMPICGRLISKPGFSTFSEACRQDTPIITITREGFAEAPVLQTQIQDYLPHRILSPHEFYGDDWSFLAEPLEPARKSEPIPKGGNGQVARRVKDFFQA
jgi:hypothetical protein